MDWINFAQKLETLPAFETGSFSLLQLPTYLLDYDVIQKIYSFTAHKPLKSDNTILTEPIGTYVLLFIFQMIDSISSNTLQIPDTGANISYLPKDDPKAADLIFITDSLNFCFWSYTGALKWTVDGHSGYYALEAALARAVKVLYSINLSKYEGHFQSDDSRFY